MLVQAPEQRREPGEAALDDEELEIGELLENALREETDDGRTVIAFAVASAQEGWNLIARNPADAVVVPRPTRKELTTLRKAQVQALFDTTAGDRLHALWVLLATTGLRLGEALGLQWEDVDLDAGVIRVQRALQDKRNGGGLVFVEPKSRQSRRAVYLVDGTAAALREHHRRQAAERLAVGPAWQDHDLVFTTPLGAPIHPCPASATFRQLLPMLGLPPVRVHDLRHTAATLLLKWSTHPKVVQEMLGHSTITITLDLYSHVLPAMRQDAARQFGRLFQADDVARVRRF